MTTLATDNISKKITFIEIFDYENIDFIEIPIIQRDYAQGRQSASEVREVFLTSLYNTLTTKRQNLNYSLNLDFVYGSIVNKAFSILDGQQRLTTLFLLHWYLAIKDNRFDEFKDKFTFNNQSRFTYKTRKSSTEFFNALTADDSFIEKISRTTNNSQSEKDNPIISELITDCNWFYLSWKHDPTVQACLNMLDAIEKKFKNHDEDLYLKITDTKDPYITFQFLPLDHFGLSDELYIKMNARGKPLTPFEHFKAIIEQASQSQSDSLPKFNLDARGGRVSGHEYFAHKIDTDWADLFWTYRKVGENHDTFDDEFMNFIRLLILFEYMSHSKDSSKNIANIISDTFFANNNNLKSVAVSTYKDYDCLNAQFIGNLIHILDLLDASDNHKIKTFLPTDAQKKYYPEEAMFEKVLADNTSYTEKLRFYAFYRFLIKNLTLTDIATNKIKEDLQTKLVEWMRVVYNLTENTIIDDAENFNNAFSAIESLTDYDRSILDVLANDPDLQISTFSQDQVVEEKIKANLILKSDDWREAIFDAEAHPFFKGQIGFLLNFSGILEFYREHQNCDWDASENVNYLEAFKKYAISAGAVFNLIQIQNTSQKINYAWERAVLSKGVYFTKKSYDRYNLLSTRETKNNIKRDHSWKRLLRIGSAYMKNEDSENIIEARQSYVKAVLDDPDFNTHKLQESLENISAKAVTNENIEYWRKAFIQYPVLFDYCKQGFILKNKDEFVLFKESQRNFTQYEFYTKVIDLKLNEILTNDPDYLQPFAAAEYEEVTTTEDWAHQKIINWHFGKNTFDIAIYKHPHNFEIIFKNNSDTHNEYPQRIIDVLETLDFKPYVEEDANSLLFDQVVSYVCDLGDNETGVDKVLCKLDEVLEELRLIAKEVS
ncbi:DUF262 domain-containing protein [Psychrobacter sp. I-STPA10]|uniref:DUF262 domain-containing protein n=1 Tax=Psychrobacter sp. I-STPA10 TaxID=2585769 RepID=UPI001E2BD79E|nr:DUF262 domain-containing protein [Psychrobacter sp. I-STPA10]